MNEDEGALPMLGSRAETIEALKEKVAAFDTKPVLSGTDSDSAPPTGLLATPRGHLHEVFADTLVNTGAAFGFALSQAKAMLSPARCPVASGHRAGRPHREGRRTSPRSPW